MSNQHAIFTWYSVLLHQKRNELQTLLNDHLNPFALIYSAASPSPVKLNQFERIRNREKRRKKKSPHTMNEWNVNNKQ